MPINTNISDIEMILIHEASHYLYTNLLTNRIIARNEIDSLIKEIEKNYKKTSKWGSLSYTIKDEVTADFFSLIYLNSKKHNLDIYSSSIKYKNGNQLRTSFINIIINYLQSKQNINALFEFWAYFNNTIAYHTFSSKEKNSFEYTSIVPLEEIINKYKNNSEFVVMVNPLINNLYEIFLEEKNNNEKIQNKFN